MGMPWQNHVHFEATLCGGGAGRLKPQSRACVRPARLADRSSRSHAITSHAKAKGSTAQRPVAE
eukprot:3393991-Prymnesium_polylepis.1